MRLVVENISKSFEKKPVLKNISFELNAQDSLAIIGESGCGKSTLMRIIANLLKQSSGKISFFKGERKIQPEIGYAFQLNALFDSYTIWQNISFYKFIKNIESEEQIRKNVKIALNLVNLSHDVMDLHPKDLSGGMQKRVAIARAIITNPHILFLDEPTSGLDPSTSAKIVETINGLQNPDGNKPIKISVVHDMKVVKNISNKTLFIKNGHACWLGNTSDLENSNNQELNAFLEI
jgi:phospholipid/cholesterol/gamma-HCH transport system ATP-binding protein